MQEFLAENFSAPREFILVGLVNIPSLQIPLFFVFFVIYIITIFGNITIVTMIHSVPQLHQPMYFFLANLSLIEVYYTTTITPNTLRNFVQGDRHISYTGCFIQIYFFVALGGAECILLSVMAYDRYIAICQPLRYSIKMNPSCCVCLAVISWTLGVLNSLIQTIYLTSLPYCKDNKLSHFFCDIPPLLRLSCDHNTYVEHFVNLIGECMVVSGLSVTLASYIVIIKTVLQTSGKIKRNKTFSTCGSHLIVVSLFYTLLIPFLHPHSDSFAVEEKVVSVMCAVITPLLNPFIYTIRNRDFQKAVGKIVLRNLHNIQG